MKIYVVLLCVLIIVYICLYITGGNDDYFYFRECLKGDPFINDCMRVKNTLKKLEYMDVINFMGIFFKYKGDVNGMMNDEKIKKCMVAEKNYCLTKLKTNFFVLKRKINREGYKYTEEQYMKLCLFYDIMFDYSPGN
jgi:hypothetical protein